jgi:hypothetical protein
LAIPVIFDKILWILWSEIEDWLILMNGIELEKRMVLKIRYRSEVTKYVTLTMKSWTGQINSTSCQKKHCKFLSAKCIYLLRI